LSTLVLVFSVDLDPVAFQLGRQWGGYLRELLCRSIWRLRPGWCIWLVYARIGVTAGPLVGCIEQFPTRICESFRLARCLGCKRMGSYPLCGCSLLRPRPIPTASHNILLVGALLPEEHPLRALAFLEETTWRLPFPPVFPLPSPAHRPRGFPSW